MRCPRCLTKWEWSPSTISSKLLPGGYTLMRYRCLGCRRWWWRSNVLPPRLPIRHRRHDLDAKEARWADGFDPVIADPEDYAANYGTTKPPGKEWRF